MKIKPYQWKCCNRFKHNAFDSFKRQNMTLGFSVLSYKQIDFHKQIYEKHSLGHCSKEFPIEMWNI